METIECYRCGSQIRKIKWQRLDRDRRTGFLLCKNCTVITQINEETDDENL